jgi:hypothetical protein
MSEDLIDEVEPCFFLASCTSALAQANNTKQSSQGAEDPAVGYCWQVTRHQSKPVSRPSQHRSAIYKTHCGKRKKMNSALQSCCCSYAPVATNKREFEAASRRVGHLSQRTRKPSFICRKSSFTPVCLVFQIGKLRRWTTPQLLRTSRLPHCVRRSKPEDDSQDGPVIVEGYDIDGSSGAEGFLETEAAGIMWQVNKTVHSHGWLLVAYLLPSFNYVDFCCRLFSYQYVRGPFLLFYLFHRQLSHM